MIHPGLNIVFDLRIYRIWDEPTGPNSAHLFRLNLFTPGQFGVFLPWLAINRCALNALIRPNELRDLIQRFMWMGAEVPLNVSIFKLREAYVGRLECMGNSPGIFL